MDGCGRAAWKASVKRKPLVSSKYYFFDVGVASRLQGRRPAPGTPEFGFAFETWLLHELVCWRDYASAEPIRMHAAARIPVSRV